MSSHNCAASTHDVLFDEAIIRRFDVSGPRYTSYPTADRFSAEYTAANYRHWLGQRIVPGAPADSGRPLSLYFHIPFCDTLCFYCACNKIITKDHSRAAKYLDYLDKEMALQAAALTGNRDVIQLHWGGGTPTFLSADEIRRLVDMTRSHFNFLPDGEYSIEIDPRRVEESKIALLGELGFNRMSLGVQDFDPKVQKAVNRIQSVEETRNVIVAARAHGFQSVSVDLIYGLPHQTVDTINRTLDQVIELDPDRLSIYNYAHLPTLVMPQRRINEADLPSPDAKLEILQLCIRRLNDAGYVFIGMDHFAKPDDELAIAQRAGRLHRNFQGYSTHAEADLLAFGVSAISKVGPSYGQNVKVLDDYYAMLDQGELPVMRGLELTPDDLLRREIIQALMCHFELSFAAIEMAHQIDFHSYFAAELAALRDMEQAGLLTIHADRLVVEMSGRMLVRVIAMAFDAWLARATAARYSKVI